MIRATRSIGTQKNPKGYASLKSALGGKGKACEIIKAAQVVRLQAGGNRIFVGSSRCWHRRDAALLAGAAAAGIPIPRARPLKIGSAAAMA